MFDIIKGDCIDVMNGMDKDSIDLIVTSPPYNVNINYDLYNDSLEANDYHRWLRNVCGVLFRLIKPNSNIFINICDIGISNKDAKGIHRIGERGNFYVIPHHIIVIDEMVKIGAQYLNPIIWKKPSNHSSQFGACPRFCGTYPYPKNCHIPSEIEYVLRFRKNGLYEKVDRERKENSKIAKERWLELSNQLWEINGNHTKEHPATFPLEIPLRCIEGWSFVGDTVLDPFMGIGTTGIAAQKMKRNFIGIDVSKNYCDIARNKLENINV